MDLKPILIILVKILTSTSTIIHGSHAALMGGHIDNTNQSTTTLNVKPSTTNRTSAETIPDPSALVLPGYNLPENIFNQGKPFYVKKDPETGRINFNQKTSYPSNDGDYSYDDYISDDLVDDSNDRPSDDIYDKKNIDRKDGSFASHRPNDVNQLTPNFHNYLNLPTKYNPEKYVYPLISNSYASTKIQGSVNKFHNHKDTFGIIKTTLPSTSSSSTRPPPTYYTQTPRITRRTVATTPVSTTTTTASTSKLTTMKIYPEITTKSLNLLNSGMSHPSFTEEYEYYDTPVESSTQKTSDRVSSPPSSSTTLRAPPLTTVTTTTTKSMSLFEQLFGSYDDEMTTTTTDRLVKTTTSTIRPSSTSTDISYDDYIDEDYTNPKLQDNIAVENNVFNTIEDSSLKLKPEKPMKATSHDVPSSTPVATTTTARTTTTTSTTSKPSTTKPIVISTTSVLPPTTSRVTSLPLGDNHIINSMPPFKHHDPIIVATQNLRDKLNGERVPTNNLNAMVPSSSNIHIAPDQDTVSFVVGHHQSVGSGDEGQFIGSAIKEGPYDDRPFKPFYGHDGTVSDIPLNLPQRSEATLSVKMPFVDENGDGGEEIVKAPVNSNVVVPGKVLDANNEAPKNKIVFPKDEKPLQSNLITSNPEKHIITHPKKGVLSLNSEPLSYQLPSDLTPPKKQDPIVFPSTRFESLPPNKKHIKPPWDPRPGHFYNGKPEYARPPRPPPPQQQPARSPEIAYKRIDNLPNILPQFRPNKYYNNPPPPHAHPHPQFYDQRFHRQPLLERPSNRPVGFFEKLAPPPPPPAQPSYNYQRRNGYGGPGGPPPPPPPPLPPQPSQPQIQPELDLYQTPPNIQIPGVKADGAASNDDGEVETLQMIQAKNEKDVDRRVDRDEYNEDDGEIGNQDEDEVKNNDGTVRVTAETDSSQQTAESNQNKTIYRVYPVKTAPIHLDTLSSEVKEGVVVGTRLQELPLPPSKIDNDFNYQITDRNDAPILRPHVKTGSNGFPLVPTKVDFPYPLEKPPNNQLVDDGSTAAAAAANDLVIHQNHLESRIVTSGGGSNNNKVKYDQPISATLKTYTDKPIAIAYTPTTDISNLIPEKYSMPNYGRPVIPEIRTGVVENADTGYSINNNKLINNAHSYNPPPKPAFNHRIDLLDSTSSSSHPDNLNFQAPFHASIKLDPVSSEKGWSVVVRNNKTEKGEEDNEVTTTGSGGGTTTVPFASTSEFDIENFKPQLIGGFQPIYPISEKIEKEVEKDNR